jgi:hypothetical protein
MTSQWPLQQSDFCDEVVTIAVKKNNSYFFDRFKTHNVWLTVNFKFTHWHPLAQGNNKTFKNNWHINLMTTPYELFPHNMYPKKKIL